MKIIIDKVTLQKKKSFPLWMSPGNVTKSGATDLVTFIGQILNEKLNFLCNIKIHKVINSS